MNDEGPDYSQAELAEALQWFEEQAARREMRAADIEAEMRAGLDEPPEDDDAFRRRIEEMHPWLKQWEKGQLT